VEEKGFVSAEVLRTDAEPINKNWDVFLLNSYIEKT